MGISILAWLSSRLGPIWGSRNDNQADMEMPMYYGLVIIPRPPSVSGQYGNAHVLICT